MLLRTFSRFGLCPLPRTLGRFETSSRLGARLRLRSNLIGTGVSQGRLRLRFDGCRRRYGRRLHGHGSTRHVRGRWKRLHLRLDGRRRRRSRRGLRGGRRSVRGRRRGRGGLLGGRGRRWRIKRCGRFRRGRETRLLLCGGRGLRGRLARHPAARRLSRRGRNRGLVAGRDDLDVDRLLGRRRRPTDGCERDQRRGVDKDDDERNRRSQPTRLQGRCACGCDWVGRSCAFGRGRKAHAPGRRRIVRWSVLNWHAQRRLPRLFRPIGTKGEPLPISRLSVLSSGLAPAGLSS
jgi:hypothetical protein